MTYIYRLSRRLAVLKRPGFVALVAATAFCGGQDQEPTDPLDSSLLALPRWKDEGKPSISPDSITLAVGQTGKFVASVPTWRGDSFQVPVVWSASGGTIDNTGRFSSASSGAFRIVAQRSLKGRLYSDTARVDVTAGSQPAIPIVRLMIAPDTATVPPGQIQKFAATAKLRDSSTAPATVSWSATGGTIDSAGNFKAATVPGKFRVTASSTTSLLSDTAAVVVPAPPTLTRVVLTPATVDLRVGGTQQFSAYGRMSTGDSVSVAVSYATNGGLVTRAGAYTATIDGSFRIVAVQSGGTLADTSLVAVTAALPPCVGSTTVVCPGESIQAKVDAAGPGAAFTIKAGVHRLQSIAPKSGNTFTGEPGAILSGAKVLTGWVQDGSRWYVAGQTQQRGPTANAAIRCKATSPRCDNAEDLWIDNALKVHVATLAGVGPGKWFFDYLANRIYVGDDPAGKTVETSVTEYALAVHVAGIANVTLKGLVIEKYANMAQTGAVGGAGWGNGWIVRDNEIRFNHGAGTRGNLGMQVVHNNIHHNGQLGLGGGGYARVDSNEIAYNNVLGFNDRWEAGGTKFVATSGLVVRGNFSHHNHGPGLWSDINNINILYESNRVEDNDGAGIDQEIGYAAVIRNNLIRRNGATRPSWVEGTGILVLSSRDVEVTGNTLENNWGGGIYGFHSDRGIGTYGPWELRNFWVHDNTITMTSTPYGVNGIEQVNNPAVFDPSFNNRWTRNVYHVSGVERPFNWLGRKTWAQWRAAGQDLTGAFGP